MAVHPLSLPHAASFLLVAALAHAPRAPGRVVDGPPMTVPRASHTATLLPNGTVLVTGGCTANGCDATALGATTELYDPRTGRFARHAPMSVARDGGHGAVRLADGRVLIAGGWSDGRPTATAEVYDPAAGRFTPVGSMTTRRAGATVTLLPDGRVLVTGGFDGSARLPSAELFDPARGTFAPAARMHEPRGEHAAAMLPGGRVLVTGGSSAPGRVLATAEVFDPATGTFAPAPPMRVARHKHAAVALADGSVLVLGGSDARDGAGQLASAELFDAAARRFAPVGEMTARRYKLAPSVVALRGGDVFVGGSATRAERYAPAARAFTAVDGEFDAGRAFSTATELPSGDVLLTGGYDARIAVTPRTWLYRPAR